MSGRWFGAFGRAGLFVRRLWSGVSLCHFEERVEGEKRGGERGSDVYISGS